MLCCDISSAQPLTEGIGKRRVTVENADFHIVPFKESAAGATLFLSLCYGSVSLDEWKGNTLVMVLGLGPLLAREA